MQIWSVQTALLLRSCRGHDGEVTDLAINLDSTMVASSSNDTTIRCWSLKACTLLVTSCLCTIYKQVKDGANMSHEMTFLTKARGDTALRQTSTLTLSWPTMDIMLRWPFAGWQTYCLRETPDLTQYTLTGFVRLHIPCCTLNATSFTPLLLPQNRLSYKASPFAAGLTCPFTYVSSTAAGGQAGSPSLCPGGPSRPSDLRRLQQDHSQCAAVLFL